MNTSEFLIGHWKLYLSMEKELMDSSNYISFSPGNGSTFSINLLKYLLSIGAEFDVICKSYCQYLSKKAERTYKYVDILDYSFCFHSERPTIMHEIIQLEENHDYIFNPLEEWKCDLADPKSNQKNCAPEWWWAYNKNKHKRNTYCKEPETGNPETSLVDRTYAPRYCGKPFFETANLANVIAALASLFIVDMYFYKDLAIDSGTDVTVPAEYSKLFYMLDWETHIVPMSQVISVNSQMKFAHRISKSDLER